MYIKKHYFKFIQNDCYIIHFRYSNIYLFGLNILDKEIERKTFKIIL